mmetsp:Transcript_23417/g.46617  ORF Transcript_23417/g.46617 Transcript_23417/m.46617 type:complete len:203 (+) Transcript_23417:465-1073(+)
MNHSCLPFQSPNIPSEILRSFQIYRSGSIRSCCCSSYHCCSNFPRNHSCPTCQNCSIQSWSCSRSQSSNFQIQNHSFQTFQNRSMQVLPKSHHFQMNHSFQTCRSHPKRYRMVSSHHSIGEHEIHSCPTCQIRCHPNRFRVTNHRSNLPNEIQNRSFQTFQSPMNFQRTNFPSDHSCPTCRNSRRRNCYSRMDYSRKRISIP